MGDRGNIVIRHDAKRLVYVYTHWHGHEIQGILADVLRGDAPKNDHAYITARIVVAMHERCMGDVGVAPCTQDNERPVLLVDPTAGTVTTWRASEYDSWDESPPDPSKETPLRSETFAEFVARHTG